MPDHPLRHRVETLIAALRAADVRPLGLVLNDVTPEQLVEAYPDVTIGTWVSRTGTRAVAIDSAKVPDYPDIEAQRHRDPSPAELAKLRDQPHNSPGQHYFEGDRQ